MNYLRIFIHRFTSDQCPHVAAALTFTSLLALVPLLAISVSLINNVPAAQDSLVAGQEYLFQIFAPEFGDEIKTYLQVFVTKTQSLTTIGIIFIAFTALLTLDTIEKTLNRIWRVKKSRNVLMRFSIYFIILTLGPVLVGISLSVTTYLATLTHFTNTISVGDDSFDLLSVLPVLTTTFAFTLLYKIVPNTKVSIYHALMGGFVAALLFELSKRGFAYFLTSFSTYQLIYGALAAIPITLIWFYVSWLVILIGAEVTASSFDFLNYTVKKSTNTQVDLCVALKVLGDIGFLPNHDGMSSEGIMTKESHIPDELIQNTVNKLAEQKLIIMTDGMWYLAKDKDSYSIQDLLAITNLCHVNYLLDDSDEAHFSENIEIILAQLNRHLKDSPPVLVQSIYE